MSGIPSERCPEDGGQTPANPPCRKDLVEAWKTAYGRLPPKRTSTRLLALAQAYHRQVTQHGGLSLERRAGIVNLFGFGDAERCDSCVSSADDEVTHGQIAIDGFTFTAGSRD